VLQSVATFLAVHGDDGDGVITIHAGHSPSLDVYGHVFS